MNARDKIVKMPIPERVSMAKEKTRRVVDHLMYLLALHENNAILFYSPTLSAQIPTSFAANAFNVFQRGLHQFEIVRLCALWDSVDLDKENVPTVIELIDHLDVIESLAQETAAQHGQGIDDPELKTLTVGFGQKQAEKARCDMRKAIDDSRVILASPKHASIMNLRDKHLAHSLAETRRERKAGPVAPMKYGDEREVLNATLPIAQALYCWVNGTSFSFDASRKIDRKNAEALWGACIFNIRNTGALHDE
jgi:hypothetical protein